MEQTQSEPQVLDSPELLNRGEVAKLLRCSQSYVDAHTPDLPRIKLGRKVLFAKTDVIVWLLAHKEGVKTCKQQKTIISSRPNS